MLCVVVVGRNFAESGSSVSEDFGVITFEKEKESCDGCHAREDGNGPEQPSPADIFGYYAPNDRTDSGTEEWNEGCDREGVPTLLWSPAIC